jgi:hypothetical protein
MSPAPLARPPSGAPRRFPVSPPGASHTPCCGLTPFSLATEPCQPPSSQGGPSVKPTEDFKLCSRRHLSIPSDGWHQCRHRAADLPARSSRVRQSQNDLAQSHGQHRAAQACDSGRDPIASTVSACRAPRSSGPPPPSLPIRCSWLSAQPPHSIRARTNGGGPVPAGLRRVFVLRPNGNLARYTFKRPGMQPTMV